MAINILAVIVTAVIGMALGALWYSPLMFGKQWMKLQGFTEADMKKAKQKGMAGSYAVAFIGVLVMTYVLALLLEKTGAATVGEGALAGALLWLGFIATTTIGSVLWEQKPVALYVLNNAHYLVVLIIAGAILAVW